MSLVIIHKVIGKTITIFTFVIVAIGSLFIIYFEAALGMVLTNGLLLYVCLPSLIFGIIAWGYNQCQYINDKNELVEECQYFFYKNKEILKIEEIIKIIYIRPVIKSSQNTNRYGRKRVIFKMDNGSENIKISIFDQKLMSLNIKKINGKIQEEEIDD